MIHHITCRGNKGLLLENGYTGMSPFTILELPFAIPNTYVYIKCIHAACSGQIRSTETTAIVEENNMYVDPARIYIPREFI